MKLKVINSGSNGNCYVLKPKKGPSLMLECGVTIKQIKQSLNYDLDIAACILTHEHGDHARSAKDIIQAGIPLICSNGTAEALELDRATTINFNQPFFAGSFIIMPFHVYHDAKEPYGFLINHPEMGDMVFATDTSSLPVKFEKVNHWLIEANYSVQYMIDNLASDKLNSYLADRIVKNHMSLETCIETMQVNNGSNAKSITLIHLSSNNANAEHFTTRVMREIGIKPNVAVAGLDIEL